MVCASVHVKIHFHAAAGSYFYFNGTDTLSTETRLLTFPTQKYLLNISFAYFISSSLELTIIQENVHHIIIESNQTQIKWEKASYVLAPPAVTGEVILSVDTFDHGEGQVDPQADPLILGIDDITMTYQIPCDFDLLNQIGAEYCKILFVHALIHPHTFSFGKAKKLKKHKKLQGKVH